MKAKLLFLLIFISFITYGQKYIELYKEHLPAKILQWDAESKEMINSQIEGKIMLNPSLMYSFIEYLSKRYDENILNEDENLLNYHKTLTAKQYKIRNRWIEKEIEEIQQNHPFEKTKDQVIRYLKTRMADEMNVQPPKVTPVYDHNLEAFYALIYYTNNPKLEYRTDEDYARLVDNFLVGSIKQIVDDLKLYKDSGLGEKIALEERITSLWYVFDKYGDQLPYPENKDASEYLLELYSIPTTLSRTFEVNLIGSFNSDNPIRINEKYHLPILPDLISVTKDFNGPQVSFGINITMFLKNTKTIFSNLSFEGSYHKNNLIRDEKIDQPLSGKIYGDIPELNYMLYQNQNQFTLKSVQSISIKIGTPIYYLSEYFCIYAGSMILYNRLSYNWLGRYAFSLQSSDGDILVQQNKTFANDLRSVNQILILPVIDLNLSFFHPVIFKVTGNNKFIGLTLMLNLYPFVFE